MKYTVEKKEGKLFINFTVKNEEWETFVQKAYEQNKGKYNVPGFRKGHVPRRVLENTYGKGIFFEDALYASATEYYGQYLDKNKNVVPVARPVLDESSVKVDEKSVKYAVVVVVKPDVVLGEYKGLTIAKTKVPAIKAAEVDAEIKRVQERNARFIEITDRAVAEGDEINLDYSGSVAGVKFEGGTAQGQTLVIGSHTFIPGFEEQLVGMNIGEEKDINVTFPTEYHSEELAGKEAVFAVKVNAIKVKELPKVDDEFAKDVSEFATLKEYKADIKKSIKADKEKAAQHQDESNLVEAVVTNAQVEIPNEMIEEQIEDYVEEFKYQLMYQGISIEDYFKYTNSTMEDLRASHKDRAQKAVLTRLVFEQIVKEEKIKADKKSVNAKIKEYAAQLNKDVKEVEATLSPDHKAYFENQVITEKLLAFLKAENTIA